VQRGLEQGEVGAEIGEQIEVASGERREDDREMSNVL